MTNYEKYKDEIIDLISSGVGLAVKDGKPVDCIGCLCKECIEKGSHNCGNKIKEWLNSEYEKPQVDWSKVAVDTPIIVNNEFDIGPRKRHFAEYRNGDVYAWEDGRTSYTTKEMTKWECARLVEEE